MIERIVSPNEIKDAIVLTLWQEFQGFSKEYRVVEISVIVDVEIENLANCSFNGTLQKIVTPNTPTK